MLKKVAPLVVAGTVALLIIAGTVFAVLNRQRPAADLPQATNNPAPSQPVEQQQPTQTKQPGAYQAYSQTALAQTSDSRLVLFFHASWCPQCRALEKDIQEQGVPDGIVIFKVNYDDSSELKKKYGVTLQTTFVEVDTQGNLLKKHVAYNEPTLPATLKALDIQ